jgi:dTDP-4-dehydrorhamnose 3,5-epimerase-like enzyme
MGIQKRGKPEIIILNGLKSSSGLLTFIDEPEDFPIQIKRTFWITGVPEAGLRGVHAHLEETQVLVCLQGRLNIFLEDLEGEKFQFELKEPNQALVLPAMVWSEVTFFDNAILLVLSNKYFSEKDYIRKKQDFERLQQEYSIRI